MAAINQPILKLIYRQQHFKLVRNYRVRNCRKRLVNIILMYSPLNGSCLEAAEVACKVVATSLQMNTNSRVAEEDGCNKSSLKAHAGQPKATTTSKWCRLLSDWTSRIGNLNTNRTETRCHICSSVRIWHYRNRINQTKKALTRKNRYKKWRWKSDSRHHRYSKRV